MNNVIVCLLGKPPKTGTIFDRIRVRMALHDVQLHIELPHKTGTLDTQHWPQDALIVHRGLSIDVMLELSEREREGWRCCNAASASVDVQDRAALAASLEAGGLPVPRTRTLDRWVDVRALDPHTSIVVKARDGALGRGSRILSSPVAELPQTAPFSGPYHVEECIANNGRDHKLYIAGTECFGLIKPWPREAKAPPEPLTVSSNLAALALATGAATGLEVYGVDVVMGPDGPVIVDVNVFPSFNGIEGADNAIARHILRRLDD